MVANYQGEFNQAGSMVGEVKLTYGREDGGNAEKGTGSCSFFPMRLSRVDGSSRLAANRSGAED